MIHYPNIDPVLIRFNDFLQIRWYGVMYIFGFFMAWLLLRHRTKNLASWQSGDTITDFLFYMALGVLLGGRLGYMIFYDGMSLLTEPLSLFAITKGGMSFHGGLIGVTIALILFCRKKEFNFFMVSDLVAPLVPLGLGAGRVGNFINGELWGRVTDVPWAMIFPYAGPYPRHPSQLYAVLLEGVLLFLILWIYSSKSRKIGRVSGLFLMGYGSIRIFEEFFRQPDPQYGYLAFNWLTMGQVLCVPMLLIGLFLWVYPFSQPVSALANDKA